MTFSYNFPYIQNISEVLPAIEGRPEFVVADRGTHKIINYNVNFEDTFPPVNGDVNLAIRRECRGIIFDAVTGDIIRRPYHKFKNVNECEETLEKNVSLDESHAILEKLDGSMIAPFYINGELIWGTKMGDTDVAKPVQEFVKNNPKYNNFAEKFIKLDWTPIFEWCSRKQRIVMDYPEDQLILTGMRHMNTGSYAFHNTMVELGLVYDIPVVRAFDPKNDLSEFVKYVHDLQDLEGFVVRFDSGHMVKLKCHWYVNIHRAKEAILQDRNIVEMILENTIDDVKAHLQTEDRVRLIEFEETFHSVLYEAVYSIHTYINDPEFFNCVDRKTFALNHAPAMDQFTRAIVFKCWDDRSYEKVYVEVVNTVRNNLGSNTKYNTIRDAWLEGIEYNG